MAYRCLERNSFISPQHDCGTLCGRQSRLPYPLLGGRGAKLNHWVMDAEKGFLLEPMRAGIRLATGAELADLDSPPQYKQLAAAEKVARKLLPLGKRRDGQPWKGARPMSMAIPELAEHGLLPEHEGNNTLFRLQERASQTTKKGNQESGKRLIDYRDHTGACGR